MRASLSTLAIALTALLASTLQLAHAQDPQETLALYEPPDGKVMFGAWVQTEEGDTPQLMNSRLGLNASVIQIAQSIPMQPYDYVTGAGGPAPEELIERTETDAAVFLTIYPYSGLEILNVTHYTDLGNQILNWTENYNRSVFLRWAPEMNGNWMAYGLQPLMFVDVWRTMYTIVKQIAPQTAIVWAPNTGQGYPYSMPLPANATEAQALDTSGDGELSPLDSPFAPYYPGAEYVDWVGLSVYYKGPNSQNVNVPQPQGYCYGALRNHNPNNGVDTVDPWYENYCVGRNKACMFAESGPAYHDMIFGDQGVSDAVLKQAWIEDCLTNVTFFQENIRLKMMMHFEYEKNETDSGVDDHRDFRITNKTEVLQGFQSALATMVGEVYTWANYRPIPVSTPNVVTQTNLLTTTDANGNTIIETSKVTTSTFSFITIRNTQTGFPSLFGDYYSSAAKAVIVSCAVFASTVGVLLGGTIFFMRV